MESEAYTHQRAAISHFLQQTGVFPQPARDGSYAAVAIVFRSESSEKSYALRRAGSACAAGNCLAVRCHPSIKTRERAFQLQVRRRARNGEMRLRSRLMNLKDCFSGGNHESAWRPNRATQGHNRGSIKAHQIRLWEGRLAGARSGLINRKCLAEHWSLIPAPSSQFIYTALAFCAGAFFVFRFLPLGAK